MEGRRYHFLFPKVCSESSSKKSALVCVSTEAFEEISVFYQALLGIIVPLSKSRLQIVATLTTVE